MGGKESWKEDTTAEEGTEDEEEDGERKRKRGNHVGKK